MRSKEKTVELLEIMIFELSSVSSLLFEEEAGDSLLKGGGREPVCLYDLLHRLTFPSRNHFPFLHSNRILFNHKAANVPQLPSQRGRILWLKFWQMKYGGATMDNLQITSIKEENVASVFHFYSPFFWLANTMRWKLFVKKMKGQQNILHIYRITMLVWTNFLIHMKRKKILFWSKHYYLCSLLLRWTNIQTSHIHSSS